MNGAFFLCKDLCPSYADSSRLHLATQVVPATHEKAARPPRLAAVHPGECAYRASHGDRDDNHKEGGVPDNFRPQFAGVEEADPGVLS